MRKMVLAALAATMMCGSAEAALIINVYQDGGNVIASGSGSINTIGFIEVPPSTSGSGLNSGAALIRVGGTATTAPYSIYSVTTGGPRNFGTTVNKYVASTTNTGDVFGVFRNSDIFYLPINYVSGSYLVGASTFSNVDLATLGLSVGSYVITTPADSVTVNVSLNAPASQAPEPASWVMMIAGFGAVGAAMRRRKLAVSFA